MPDKRIEITIVGGGIAGLTTAWSLQKEGYSNVTILEKKADTTMAASGVNPGLIQTYHESPRIRRELRRGISLLDSYQQRHNTSFFEPSPSLWAVSKDQYLKLEEDGGAHLDWEQRPHHEVPSPFVSQEANQNQHWISFGNDAVLNALKLGDLLQWELEHSSVTVRTNSELKTGTKTSDGWKLKLDEGETLSADLIINAAGAWANDVAKRLGREPCDMTPVPRQLFRVERKIVPRSLSYVKDRDRQIILRRSEKGTLISHAQESDEIHGTTESSSIDHLETVIGSRFPQIDLPPIKTARRGRIASTPDRKPIIEPNPEDRTVIRATGLNDYGLSYSFHVGEKVLELL